MTDEETKSVNNQEAAIPEVNSDSQEPKQVQNETAEKDKKENSKEYNFARIREKNAELERQIYELKHSFEQKNAPAPQPDELDSIGDDDIITKRQADKLAEKKAALAVEKALKQREVAALPERTKSMFADYDQVMTIENVKKFEQEEPGLAAACANAPNPWEATYKMLKKFVLPVEDKKSNKLEEKMKENLSKPISSNSVGRSGPLANANDWASASKEDLYKEMMKAARSG